MTGAVLLLVVAWLWQAGRRRTRPRIAALVRRTRPPREGRRPLLRRPASGRASDPASAALPDTVDLLGVAAGAGLPAVLAVGAVAGRAPPPWDGALRATADRVAKGQLFVDALAELAPCGDAGRRLAVVLRGSAAGADLSGSLERLALDARDLRRRTAEEAARRVPVRLLAPLVLCVLPAFVLLALVPLVAGAFEGLHL